MSSTPVFPDGTITLTVTASFPYIKSAYPDHVTNAEEAAAYEKESYDMGSTTVEDLISVADEDTFNVTFKGADR